MHFSFSSERFSQSRKYRNDIEHDAERIGEVYREKREQGIFDLTHSLAAGKDCGMKLMNFEFSRSSELQYLMAVRNVRSEMIRVLESSDIPDSRAIIGELNRSVRENRRLDTAVYQGLDVSVKTENGKKIDAREEYEMLLQQYPTEAQTAQTKVAEPTEETRVPITVGEDVPAEFSPFLESPEKSIINEKRRES